MTTIPFRALLLLALAAGATTITADAHAQTNTERIASIHEIVQGIQDGLGTSTSATDTITSSITGFQDALDDILATAEANRQSISSLSAMITTVSTGINDIKATLNATGSTDITEDVNFLSTTINRNHVSISDRLDTLDRAVADLEIKLDLTQATIDEKLDTTLAAIGDKLDSALAGIGGGGGTTTTTTTPPSTGTPRLSGEIVRQTEPLEVTAYMYKSDGQERRVGSDIIYELDLAFSCDGSANIDEIRTTVTRSSTIIIPTTAPGINTDRNYLKVDDGQFLYDSSFQSSPTQHVVLTRDISYESLRNLGANEQLRFESQQYNDDNNRISSSTRASPVFLYDISIVYLADRNTTCSFSLNGDSTTGALSESKALLVYVDLSDNERTLRQYSETVSCGNDPVDITNIIIDTGDDNDDWLRLVRHASLELTFLDGVNDNTADVSLTFDSDGTIVEPEYPVHFSGADLRISGTMPSVDEVYIDILYNTVSGGSCSVE